MDAAAGLEPATSLPRTGDSALPAVERQGLYPAELRRELCQADERLRRTPGRSTARRLAFASSSTRRNSGSNSPRRFTSLVRSYSLLILPLCGAEGAIVAQRLRTLVPSKTAARCESI